MLIDLLPVWLLFFVIVAIVLISVEVGFRVGRAVYGKADREKEAPASSISGVILGLLAFIIAFTFSIVTDRYEKKKALVREEANSIRTAFHRTDFLPEPDRKASRTLLLEYVDQRIALAQARDPDLVQVFMANALRIQQQLWEMAVINGRRDMNSDVGALYVESMNDLANLHASRVSVGLQARIPTGNWIVLLSLLTLGMGALGYHTAIADSRRSHVTPILAVAFALVLALVAALDHPGDNFMPISQQPLVNLQSEIKVPSDTETFIK